MLKMKSSILKCKLMILWQVLQNQIQFSLPGLYWELEYFLNNNGIHEKNIIDFTKSQWRKFVSERVSAKNEEDLLRKMSTSSKIRQSNIMSEPYEVKGYLKTIKPEHARLKYRERYFMLKGCKLNFANNPDYKRQEFVCDYCPSISSQHHVKICKEYYQFRHSRDLEKDDDLVQYLVDVMQHRREHDDDHAD